MAWPAGTWMTFPWMKNDELMAIADRGADAPLPENVSRPDKIEVEFEREVEIRLDTEE